MARKSEYFRRVEEAIRLIRSIRPFEDISAGARRRRRERACKDIVYFAKTYLPHYVTYEFADFHREILSLLDIRDTPVVVAAPRGHGKSTLVTLLYPLREILCERRHFIIIASASNDAATSFTMRLKLELENNQRILTDFGEQKGHIWADDEFIVRNGIGVLARGRGQAVRGAILAQYRPDLIILDDVEDDELVRNPRRVERVIDWVTGVMYPALEPGGSFFMIGTKLSKRSALAQLMQREGWISREYDAIKEDGSPLWPAKFTIERLMRIKRIIGTRKFNREYRNKPDDEENIFQEGWIRYYDDWEIAGKVLRVYGAIDPSIGESKKNDYKAIITIGVSGEGVRYVLDAWIRHDSIDRMLDTMYERYKRYNHLLIGLEIVAFQRLLIREFDRKAGEYGFALPIRGIENRVAKEARIERLSPLIERGLIRFKRGQGDQDLLIEQLVYFPDTNDDGPDALEMAERISQSYGGELRVRRKRLGVGLYGY